MIEEPAHAAGVVTAELDLLPRLMPGDTMAFPTLGRSDDAKSKPWFSSHDIFLRSSRVNRNPSASKGLGIIRA